MGKDLKGKELGVGISQRKDGMYTARFTGKNGIRKQKYFKKLQECRNWIADHVFLNSKGKPIPNTNYDKCMAKLCDKAKIRRISMHTLRHTFETRCIESCMKPKTLQKILGHADISVTMNLYVHVTEDEKEKEMLKFERMYGQF